MKKEKYIREITTAAGTKMLKIEIRLYGQSFRKSIKLDGFKNKSAAWEAARQIRDEALMKLRSGYTVQKSKIPTVKTLYEKSYELLPVRIRTRKNHDILFRSVLDLYGNTPIDKISAADVQGSINTFAKTHSDKETSRLLSVWKRIYKVSALLEINVINRTVIITIPECQEARHHKKDIAPEDLEHFCDVLLTCHNGSESDQYRHYAVYYAIQIMKYCGLRPAEVFALTKSDINLIAGTISVNKAARSGYDSPLEIGKTKTKKSVRLVPIPAELKPILIDCLRWSKHDLLLADYFGKIIDIDTSNRIVIKTRKAAGVQFNMYMLRHQFSSDLFRSGTDPAVIRDLMGHESATMSLDYATTKEEDRKKAVDKRKFS